MDRFLFKVLVTYSTKEEEREVMKMVASGKFENSMK